ncbi:PQQ-binding-like beta-propeller repeat protein [Plantactinospora sp. WMMB782]|uniref:outer membrane protein assembly factor BamB family protein n=1 Tax=Plantactinospora sp. WMMB782 TaxID=3404121 RepID=UPI003B924F7C
MNDSRRTAAAAGLALACVVALVPAVHAPPASAQGGSQWTMGGHDIRNTRSNPAERLLSPSTVDGLDVAWTLTTDGDVSATPAVVDGAVYFPDWGGTVWKVDAASGEVIWSRSVAELAGVADTFSRTAPVVAGDTVYLGTQAGARLLALDTETGDLRWNTPMETHPDAILTSSPAIHDGTLYQGVSSLEFLNAGDPAYDCCTFRGSLAAVDAATGELRWQTHTLPDQGPGGDVFSGASVWGSTPTLDPEAGTVYVGTGQNYSVPASAQECQENGGTPQECLPPWNAKDSIIALDMATGEIRWSTGPARFDAWNLACLPGFPPNNCPNPGPDHDTSDGTHLFTIPGPDGQPRKAVGAGQKSGEFWMLDALTGEIIWSASVGPGSVLGGIEWGTANDGEKIFFAETNYDREPYQLPDGQTIEHSSFGALDAATGAIVWQVPEPHGGLAVGPATTANGVVYHGSLNGYMYALDADDGQLLWEHQGAGASNAGPAIVDGRLYWGNGYQRLGAASTTFYAFGLPGAPTTPPGTPPTSAPTSPPTSAAS